MTDNHEETPNQVDEVVDDIFAEACGQADLLDPLEHALQERDEAREKVLRVLAELENYRSRVNRERDDARKYAEIDLMRDLLPVWDNLTRAIEVAEKAAEKSPDVTAILDGMRMVETQLISVLSKHSCQRLIAVGEVFDPHKHASISQVATTEQEPNTIIHETQAGFVLHDRVVRPSQVVLAVAVK